MEVNGKERQAEGKSKNGLKKRFILTTHENCEESISSTPRIRNLRKPSRTRVRNWKRQLLLLMPCKIMKNCGSGSDKNTTKLACILEANESTRMRMGYSQPHNHEDHIAGKGENSLQHYNFGSQIYSYASSYENSSSKSSSGQGMGKIGQNFGVDFDISQK